MSYYDEDREEEDREPRTLPDMYIEAEDRCTVCGVKNSIEQPMRWACAVCGGPTHAECGADTEPSGGWDRDYDVNYWMCNNCLKSGSRTREEVAATIIDDMRREALEVARLQRCDQDHDFKPLVTSIIEDLEVLAEKYKGLLQSLYPESEVEQPQSVTVASVQGDDDLPSIDGHPF